MSSIKNVIAILFLIVTSHDVLSENFQTSAETAPKAFDNSSIQKPTKSLAISSTGDNIPTVVMGYCHPVGNGHFDPLIGEGILTPNIQAKNFLNFYEHIDIGGTTKTSILLMPSHGELHKVSEVDKGRYYRDGTTLDPEVSYYIYIPEDGYTGKDSATILVNFGTVRVNLVYFIKVTDDNFISECDTSCKKRQWEISSTFHTDTVPKDKQEPFAVVIKDYPVPKTESNPAFSLTRGLIVAFDHNLKEGKIHVVAPYGRYIWVPREIVATNDQFVRVNLWNGARTTKDEGIDNLDTYVFHKDGSFVTTFGGRCGSETIKGHLYRYKNIIWMRDEHDKGIPQIRNLFFLPSSE